MGEHCISKATSSKSLASKQFARRANRRDVFRHGLEDGHDRDREKEADWPPQPPPKHTGEEHGEAVEFEVTPEHDWGHEIALNARHGSISEHYPKDHPQVPILHIGGDDRKDGTRDGPDIRDEVEDARQGPQQERILQTER